MIGIFDDLDFLNFIKQELEEKIKQQEAVIDVVKLLFYDNQLNYELTKELHRYQNWLDSVKSYIIIMSEFGGSIR